MLTQGTLLGLEIHLLFCALKGRRNPPPFQGGRQSASTIPGALPRAAIFRVVGAAMRMRFPKGESFQNTMYETTANYPPFGCWGRFRPA